MAAARLPGGKEWGLLAASIGVALVLAEAVCRYALPAPGFVPRHGSWLPGAVRPHPARRYALRPGFSARITAEDTFGTMHIDINADGIRERPLETLRGADLRILALGDSYTFGFGLEAEEAWPRRLEAELQRRLPARSVAVVNTGVPGYNLAQIEDMAREMLPRTAPQLVIAAVYAGGFERMLNPMTNVGDLVMRTSEARVVRLVDGGLVRSRMFNQTLVDIDLWLKTHWYSAAWVADGVFVLADAVRESVRSAAGAAPRQQPPDPWAGVAEGLAALGRIRELVSQAGGTLVVLAVTRFDRADRADARERAINEKLAAFCAAAAIPYLDPTPMLEEADIPVRVRPGDYHWSAAANALAARELAGLLARRALIPGMSSGSATLNAARKCGARLRRAEAACLPEP